MSGLHTWVLYLIPLPLLLFLASNYWRLRHVPGPFLAAFTDLWRLFVVWGGKAEQVQIELHKKYGDVVRLGPNCVSISLPDVVGDIYGIGKGFIKASPAISNAASILTP